LRILLSHVKSQKVFSSPARILWNSLDTISLNKNFVNEKNLHSIPERECAGCDYHRNCISGYGVSFSSYYFQLNEVNNPYHPMLKMFETGIAGFFYL